VLALSLRGRSGDTVLSYMLWVILKTSIISPRNWSDDNDTVSGIAILDTTAVPKMPSAIHLVQNSPVLILGLEVCRPVKSRLYCEL